MEAAASILGERVTPQSLEAEQATLGAMLNERYAIDQVVEILRPEDFYYDAHRLIYEAIINTFGKGEPVDHVTVVEELRRMGKLEQVGGPAYIGLLWAESCPSPANAADYARIVEEKAILRNLISAAHQIAGWAYEAAGAAESQRATPLAPSSIPIESIIDRAESTIFNVGQRRVGSYFLPLPQLLKTAFAAIDQQYHYKGMARGLPTGFRELDNLTSGLQPGDLIVIAGRPSMGKTALALSIAENVATRQKQVVAIFSLEMTKEQLVQRILCSMARVDSHRLRSGNIREQDWNDISKAVEKLYEAPLFIDDSTDLSPFEMRAKARRLRAEHGLSLLIVDYLQLVRPPRRMDNRVQEVSEIARSLKSLARELHVPLLVLSQLSRAPEQRESKRPVLADLRDSGAIEAEADVVAFIYREAYYEQARRRKKDRDKEEGKEKEEVTAEIIVAKQRNGPVGTIELAFLPKCARFENLTRQYEQA